MLREQGLAVPEKLNVDSEIVTESITTGDVLSGVIDTETEVIVVGPNRYMTDDPTLAFISRRMAQIESTQKLYVVDPILEWSISSFGWGALNIHLANLRTLSTHGIEMIKPTHAGENSGMLQMNLPSNTSRRVIIDHHTSTSAVSILVDPNIENTSLGRELLKNVYAEYRKTLGVDGKLVLFTNSETVDLFGGRNGFPELITIQGFSLTKHVSLKRDQVKISINSAYADWIREINMDEDELLGGLGYTIYEEAGNFSMVLEPEAYPSKECYIFIRTDEKGN